MNKWRFKSIFFVHARDMDTFLNETTAEMQKEGFDFHDVRMAQSSASGSGMSAILVFREAVS
jgi:hypothetical protein